MLNNTVIVGRLVKDPEIKELENGKKVSNIVVAVPRSYKNADGVYKTDFIKCILWDRTAENVTEYCQKGDVLGINGRLQTKEYENESGKHYELELIAERITFIADSKEKEKTDEMDM